MRSRSRPVSLWARATVSRMSGRSEASASSCLGRAGVLIGQNRDPTPPARIVTQGRRESVDEFTDACQKLLGTEGFGHEVRGSPRVGFLAVGVLTLRREHE